jgi:putative transferase (TIGR04331 family)
MCALLYQRDLMVEAAMPRYACYMYGLFTSATGQLKYMEDQYDFARALPVRIRARLNVRLYHHDYRWAQKDRWNLECPGVKVSFKGGPMLDEMNRSRLFIGTYNSTAYLEALAADFPTVLFWDKDAQRVRPSARPYFDKLEKAGLYFSSAKKAAEKVTDIFDLGVVAYPEVKKARAEFSSDLA